MATILSVLANPVVIQVVLAILGALVGKSAQNSTSRKNFLALVESLHGDGLISVKLREKYAAQVDENAKKADEQWKREHPNG